MMGSTGEGSVVHYGFARSLAWFVVPNSYSCRPVSWQHSFTAALRRLSMCAAIPSFRERSIIDPIFVVPILLLSYLSYRCQSPLPVRSIAEAGTTRPKKYDIVVPAASK